MKILIIQTSPMHTCSTLLVNSIYGLIPELTDKKIILDSGSDENFDKYFNNIIVIKSHHTHIDALIERYEHKYKLFFICSERKEYGYLIDEKYKSYNNVIVFQFEELNESHDNNIYKIIKNIYNKIINVLKIELHIISGITRIIRMNELYENIKYNSFDYVDNFYEMFL